jgi:hypothetical protein
MATLALGFALAGGGAGPGSAQPAAPAPSTEAAGGAEPTEQEMRELLEAEVERINENGGIRLYDTKSIRVRLEGFRKTGCTRYTRAFRCNGEASYSYPGSDFPRETLRHGARYRRGEDGRWKKD